jgi:hypothetical protein
MNVCVLLCRGGVFLSAHSDENCSRGTIFISIIIIIYHLLLGKGDVFLSVSSEDSLLLEYLNVFVAVCVLLDSWPAMRGDENM